MKPTAPEAQIEVSPLYALDQEELASKVDPSLEVSNELALA